MYWLREEQRIEARVWLAALARGEWPRGRVIASKQAKVLERIIAESDRSEANFV